MRKYIVVSVILINLMLGLPHPLLAQETLPAKVVAVLQKAGKNKVELEKAIHYFAQKDDSLQLKAAYFLIGNMDIHSSYNYFWADSLGKKVAFNELDYPDFDSSVWAFEKLKLATSKIHPVTYVYKDFDSIKASFLINNIEYAFKAWQKPWARGINFNDFCEFLLPYRTSIEPLQDWREAYSKKFAWLADSIKNLATNLQLDAIEQACNSQFKNTFATEKRNDPLPRLGALQLLHRKKGACEDGVDFIVLAMRSLGFPAVVDYVPYWATSTASHFLYGVPDGFVKSPLNVEDSINYKPRLPREPGKVVRTTFKNNDSTLASWYPKELIPTGFLRTSNYTDVTHSYWPTVNLSTPLFPSNKILEKNNVKSKVVFACVFNGHTWRPIWWGKVKNNETVFYNVSKGAVYLPMYYEKDVLIPAGYPTAVGYHHQLLLIPDTVNKISLKIEEQEKYLKFRADKKYTLYYWNNKWKPIGRQIAHADTKQLVFEKVPQNTIYILVPEYSQGKERPFMITKEGVRIWW